MTAFSLLVHAISPKGETFIYEANTKPGFISSTDLQALIREIFVGQYDVGQVTEVYEVRLSGLTSRIIPRTNEVALGLRNLVLSELLSDPAPQGGWTEGKVAERLASFESLVDRFTPNNQPTIRSLLLREHV